MPAAISRAIHSFSERIDTSISNLDTKTRKFAMKALSFGGFALAMLGVGLMATHSSLAGGYLSGGLVSGAGVISMVAANRFDNSED